MPRNVTVTFADGSSHVYQNAPDDVTPEQVTARASQEFGKQVAGLDGGKSSGVLDTIKSWAGDLIRGGLAAPAALVDARPVDLPANRKPPEDSKIAPQLAKAFPPDPTANPYGRAIRESIGGSLLFPGGASPSALIAATTGGIGAEAAAQTLGEGPLQRFVGGLAGGVAGGYAAKRAFAPRIQEASIAREALEGVTQEQLSAAQEMQRLAAKKGVTLDLSQALTATGASPNNLNTIRDLIANTKEGNKTQRLLHNQPTEVNNATRNEAAFIPGKDYGLEQSANNTQEAATAALKAAKEQRRALTEPLFNASGKLPREVQQAAVDEIDAFLQQPTLADKVRASAQSLRAKLVNARGTQGDVEAAKKLLAEAGNPSAKLAARQRLAEANAALAETGELEAGRATRAIKDELGPYKPTPMYQPDAQEAGQMASLAARVKEKLKAHAPLAKAEAEYARLSDELVNPLKQGPVGQFATPRGYQPDRAASTAKLAAFFDNGVSPGAGASPVRVLGKELGKADPEAFRDGFKSWLMSKLDKHAASEFTHGQAQPEGLASGVYEELFRSPRRFQGVKDAVATIAEQSGQNPTDAVRGLTNLGMVLKGAANRPQSVRGVSPQQLQEMAGHSLSANTLRVFGFLPFERVARWREGAQAAETFRTFDELLTSPEGAATLARLGKTSPMSPAFAALLQGFESGAVQANSSKDRLPQ